MINLRRLRKENGLLQQHLAMLLGVATTTYSGWECGHFEIDNKNLIKLADYFNVSVDFLLDREEYSSLFDNARIQQSEIQLAFNNLYPKQQETVLNYIHALTALNFADLQIQKNLHNVK